MKVVYKYFAVKPLKAEHPLGSGIVVEYQPGDEIPANDWGRAGANLVELGKAARVAFNVPDDSDGPESGSITFTVPVPDVPSHVTDNTPDVPGNKRGPGRPKKEQ